MENMGLLFIQMRLTNKANYRTANVCFIRLEVREMKECTVICNTRWGYCMTPKKCKSIAEAIRYAKEMEMAFRIFVNGKCIKSSWYK